MIGQEKRIFFNFHSHSLLELSLSVVVGLLLGVLVVIPPYLPLPSDFKQLLLIVPFAITVVILFKNLQKLILFAIAVSIPLNLDFSLLISPYSRGVENMANGLTIVSLTELRLSFIFVIVAIGYVLWLVDRSKINHQPILFFASTSVPALGMIFVSIISIFYAQDLQLSFFKIAQLVELFLVYFYLANHLRTKNEFQFFVAVLLGAILVESFLMVLQRFTGLEFSIAGITAEIETVSQRVAGTFGTPDTAGSIVSATMAIACVMIWLFTKNLHKVLAGICLVFGTMAIILTASRAAWISFAIAMIGAVFAGWWRGWLNGKSIILLMVIAIIILAAFYPTIVNRLTEDDRGSAASRPMMFRLAWNVIKSSYSNFIFGVGVNNYALVAHNYYTADIGNLGYIIYSSVHNAYLLAWAETGIFGLLLFLVFLANPLLRTWKYIRSNNRYLSLIALGLGLALVEICTQMLVDPFIARPKTNFVWILVAMIAGLNNIEPIKLNSSDALSVNE